MSEFQMALLFPFVPVVAFLIVEFLLDITSPPDDDDDDFDDVTDPGGDIDGQFD